MKKLITSVLLIPLLLLGGCATSQMGDPSATLAGAYIGGSLGSAVGGIIGDNGHDWRGGYRGSAIGTIVGTIAGAAIGNAVTTPKDEPSVSTYYSPSNGNREVYTNDILRLHKIRFIDDSRNQAIDPGENSKVIFEVMNEGDRTAYNIVPFVETVGKIKHISISSSITVDEVAPGDGIKYTATVYAGDKLKEGRVTLRVGVRDENGIICDAQEFTLPTHGNY